MTDESHETSHQDEDLRALLRSIDPAASLPTADPDATARLLEETMTDRPDRPTDPRSGEVPHRNPLTWIVAAAAVVLVGGAVLFATTRGDDGTAPDTAATEPTGQSGQSSQSSQSGQPGESATDEPGRPTIIDLAGADAGTDARCVVPDVDNPASVEVVADKDVVFDGVVEGVSGGNVTLAPTKFYAGGPADEVVVQAPGRDMEALLSAVSFEEGRRYLVSASDGQVSFCGFSAEYSEDLAAVYAAAFPGS